MDIAINDLSEGPKLTTPAIGVIIPTFNRPDALLICLAHLEAQTWKDFEVILVDDGSGPATRRVVEGYRAPFPLTYLSQQNSGPAKARNLAVAHLTATVCVMIGDDIFAAPNFLETHLKFHRQHPAREAAAVGLTRWSEQGQVVTPWMRWLDQEGVQFAYGDLLRGGKPSWKHFYTGNLSLKTDYLRENPFNESFSRYGMEDIELGYRLAVEHGLKMFFLPEAVTSHLHPVDFRRSCLRMIDAGASAYRFATLWPEHRHRPPRNLLKRMLLPILSEPRLMLPGLASVAGLLGRVWCPNPLMRIVLILYERTGYRQAETAESEIR